MELLQSLQQRVILTSLTRIADLSHKDIQVRKVEHKHWDDGNYVLAKVIHHGILQVELTNGRMAPVMDGDLLIGALGVRHATLEATGSWKAVGKNLEIHALTGAGLLGYQTSKSPFIPQVITLKYLGHLELNGRLMGMSDFVPNIELLPFTTPTILFMGTSMSSGKTASARVITHILKELGLSVVCAKLTGAGRYRDILAMHDAGADAIYDFVDVGLPSTIVEKHVYEERLELLLSMIQAEHADVAVVEIGASPLEPYNGATAINHIDDCIKCKILCASDPYAVLGVMHGFHVTPDIVGGPATNTLGGTELIEKLCHVPGINIIDPKNREKISNILVEKLGL